MELILTNGRVLAMNGGEERATALAVQGGRIAAVGTDDHIARLADAGAKRVDLRGRAVLPGFHDCHCHMLGVGIVLAHIDLSYHLAGDIPTLVRRLRENAPPGSGWIYGRGYDQNRMAERRHPTHWDLDLVSRERPIAITHTSGHALVANSAALKIAAIDRNTPDPAGGVIERDPATGEPTGLLLENATDLVYRAQPALGTGDLVAAIGRASAHMAAMGITSAAEASAERPDLPAIFQAADEGALRIRCHPFVLAHQLREGERFLTPADVFPENCDKVYGGVAKIFSDGALTTRTAYLREPFVDNPDNCGTPIWSEAELAQLVQGAHDAGWQIAAHAIGDAAIDLCLDCFQKALFRTPGLTARHRIEHAMLLWDDQIERMASQGIVPVFQPEFIAQLGDAYVAGLGESRAARLMPYRSGASGIGGQPLAFSSDQPVVPGLPLDGIRAAVERTTPSGRVLGAEERVSPYEALLAYTYGAAFAARCENERGRLAEGMLADLVVLSEDPTAVPPEEWSERVRVEVTAVAGEPVYGSWDEVAQA